MTTYVVIHLTTVVVLHIYWREYEPIVTAQIDQC